MVRFKNRYITVEILPTHQDDIKNTLQLKSGLFHETVLDHIQELHGDYGVAAVRNGFMAKYCNEHTRIAILRSRHGPHRLVSSSLPFVKKIGRTQVTLKTLHVGATLKHSFKFIQNHQRRYLESVWAQVKGDDERKQLELAVMDFTKTDVTVNIEKMT